jgi:tetratricopeptide (TPR) repeat protein
VKGYLSIFFLSIFFSNTLFGQEDTLLDSIIYHQKRFELQLMKKRVEQLSTLKLRQLFKYEIAFHENGNVVGTNSLSLEKLNGREKIIGKYLLIDLKRRNDEYKSNPYLEQLIKLYTKVNTSNDSIVINEILKRINNLLLSNGKNLNRYQKYISLYEKFAIDSVDNFYVTLNKIFLIELKNENNPTATSEIEIKKIDSLFKVLKKLAVSPYFKGYAQNMEANFESSIVNDQTKALDLYNQAIKNFELYPYRFARYGIHSVNFNSAIIHYELKEYNKAISLLKKILKNEDQLIYRMYGNNWLHKCYDSIGDYANAYKHFKKMEAAKDSLNLLDYAKDIEYIESLYDFEKKESELLMLAKNNKELMNKQNVLTPILVGLISLAIIVFFLYKKYRTKNKILEGEQSETLKRLDEIKKIVIKNHIVLKDKRKVYVANLMYIKSDDHYLNIFTNDGNNHFVRGKLKDIKEELPPNFIQCHRSYIVNKNFVKQQLSTALVLLNNDRIPVSRGYKEKL